MQMWQDMEMSRQERADEDKAARRHAERKVDLFIRDLTLFRTQYSVVYYRFFFYFLFFFFPLQERRDRKKEKKEVRVPKIKRRQHGSLDKPCVYVFCGNEDDSHFQ